MVSPAVTHSFSFDGVGALPVDLLLRGRSGWQPGPFIFNTKKWPLLQKTCLTSEWWPNIDPARFQEPKVGPLRAPRTKHSSRLPGNDKWVSRMTHSICYDILSINNSLIILFLNTSIRTNPCQKQWRGSVEKWGIFSLLMCCPTQKTVWWVCLYV